MQESLISLRIRHMDLIRESIINELHKLLDQRIQTYQSAIDSAIESKLNETKSSAGDKFETGRAMMQLEQEKNEMHLSNTVRQKNLLTSMISTNTQSTKILNGNLVNTDNGFYFIGIGVGKLSIDGIVCYVISAESPVGTQLLYKSVGDIVEFNGHIINIIAIA